MRQRKSAIRSARRNSAGSGAVSSLFYPETVSFLEYLPENSRIFLDEPNRIIECADALEAEFQESVSHRLEKDTSAGTGEADVQYGGACGKTEPPRLCCRIADGAAEGRVEYP